jgi:hypothetical protein
MGNHREYINSVIRKIKRFNQYNLVIILFVCFLLLIITDNSIIESILKVTFKVLRTLSDEIELLPEHDGVDDDGHRH